MAIRFATRRTLSLRLVALVAVVLMTATACSGTSGSVATPSSGAAATKLPFDYTRSLVEPGTILAGTTGTAPPISQTTASGELEGYAIDRCNAIAQRLGLKIRYVVVEFGSIVAGVTSGRFDMSCTGVPRSLLTPDFLMTYGTARAAATIVTLASDTRINSVSDVKGKVMGGNRGAGEPLAIQTFLSTQVDLRFYAGYPDMILDLKNKRIDCYAGNLTTLTYQAKNDPLLRVADKTGINPSITGEAVRKEEPELLKAIDAVELEMRNSGQLGAMQEKWYGTQILPPPPPSPTP